jgi:protease-4
MKKKQWMGIVIAGIVFIVVCGAGMLSNVLQNKLLSSQESTKSAADILSSVMGSGESDITLPTEDFVGVIDVVGTIQASSSSSSWSSSDDEYDHDLYMDYVDALESADNNKALLLYVDSPGGTVYESDQLYLKIMEYKEKTNRPVYAYFASEACSGGYYISMAADTIYANRNTWTGSIGVIVSLTNYKKLYDKLGIKEIDITSGKNKAMGSGGLNLTDEQKDILQSLVDEAYDQFTDIVSTGRQMDIETVKKLADGRIYSAKQAKENGLVDEIGSLEDLKSVIQEENALSDDITYHKPSTSASTFFKTLFGSVEQMIPKSDTELAVDIVEKKGKGVLMYYAD